MEVIYPKACGVDVHKSFIVAVICDSTSITPKYLKKRFSTFNNDLIKFKDWLIQNDCQNVYMESTGSFLLYIIKIILVLINKYDIIIIEIPFKVCHYLYFSIIFCEAI